MPNDDDKPIDLHHSQGVSIAEVLSGVDADVVKREDEEEDRHVLRVTSVLDKLEAHLSDRAKEVLTRPRHGTTPEMFVFGRTFKNAVTEADYEAFAKRFNEVCDKLNGQLFAHEHDPDFGARPKLDAVLAMPMQIPLSPAPKSVVVIYVFIYDLPFWKWDNYEKDGEIMQRHNFDVEAARKWLSEKTGFLFVREGELPQEES